MTIRTSKNSNKVQSDHGTTVFTEPRYVWLFQCSNRIVVHVATLDRTASNLPSAVCRDGKWDLIGQLVIGPETKSSAGIDIVALKSGVQADGFYLWNADIEPPTDDLRLMR